MVHGTQLFECEVRCDGRAVGRMNRESLPQLISAFGRQRKVMGMLYVFSHGAQVCGTIKVDSPSYPDTWAIVQLPSALMDAWASQQPSSVVPEDVAQAARARAAGQLMAGDLQLLDQVLELDPQAVQVSYFFNFRVGIFCCLLPSLTHSPIPTHTVPGKPATSHPVSRTRVRGDLGRGFGQAAHRLRDVSGVLAGD